MTEPAIAVRCRGITKSFPAGAGVVEVLRGIDCEIAAADPAARAIGMPAATSGIAAFSAEVSAGNKLYC